MPNTNWERYPRQSSCESARQEFLELLFQSGFAQLIPIDSDDATSCNPRATIPPHRQIFLQPFAIALLGQCRARSLVPFGLVAAASWPRLPTTNRPNHSGRSAPILRVIATERLHSA